MPTTRISATGKDAKFQVDGFWFTGSAIFTWPAGSKHALVIDTWQLESGLMKGRYVFQHWNTAAGPLGSSSNAVAITADAGIPWYNADLRIEYAVSLVFFRCPDAPCAGPGNVWVNQIAYQQDTDVWVESGSTVTLEASPGPGYLFAGWTNGTSAPLFSLVLSGPVTVYPRFALARSIQLTASPDGLQLLADRAPLYPPIAVDWGWGTVHALSAPSPQRDSVHGRLWVFSSWSDGGAAAHAYQVEPGASAASVMAVFAPAVSAMALTEPAGLNLTLDGQTVAAQTWYWAPGETHALTAPARQQDSSGAPWTFRAWSNGAPNPQTILTTADQADTGIRITAIYDPLSRIRVDSAPSGLPLTADGAACKTPCELERTVGSMVRLSAPASITATGSARLDFASFAGLAPGDGTGNATFTAAAGFRTITAQYVTLYPLVLSASQDAGSWRLSPGSGDGFYRAGTAVNVAFDAARGMSFQGWGLDLSGSTNPATLMMDGAHSVRALVNCLPDAPPPPRVVTAAGETPAAAVAPGSLASLFGTDLADSTAQSHGTPLPQSLAGVTLRCSGRLLALLFVSPQQINFQVPGDIPPGPYTLEIHRTGSPVREVAFAVARNAPGLFAAAHQDGSLITGDSAAEAGETIDVFGTGLGPYATVPPDGFPVPPVPALPLADDSEVLLNGRPISPSFAGAVPGAIGLAMVSLRIPDDLGPMPSAQLAVRVGVSDSNVLVVPLKLVVP